MAKLDCPPIAGLSATEADTSSDAAIAATRMSYVADLLMELQAIASAEGHATLTGLLALAQAEARTKSR